MTGGAIWFAPVLAPRPRAGFKALCANACKAPWPITALIGLMLIPIEASAQLGSLFLPLFRIYLAVIAAPVLWLFITRRQRLGAADCAFLGFALWTSVALALNHSGFDAMERVGRFCTETVVVWLLVRSQIRTEADWRATVALFTLLALVASLFAIPEIILGERWVHDIARAATGVEYRFSDDRRLGLLRAASVFEHPILFGLFCASIAPLAWATARSARKVAGAVTALACGALLSLSSGPLAALAFQGAAFAGERATRGLRHRGFLAAILGVAILGALEVSTPSGVIAFAAQNFSFNPQTASYRILIWEHGIDDVARSPLFGISPETWTRLHWMPDSVDHQWLHLAMRGGLPALALMALAVFLGSAEISARARRRARLSGGGGSRTQFDRAALAWRIAIGSLLLAGMTVAFFGKMQPIFVFVLALGPSLARLSWEDEGQRERDAP